MKMKYHPEIQDVYIGAIYHGSDYDGVSFYSKTISQSTAN